MTEHERRVAMTRLNAARRILEYPTRHTRSQLDYAEAQVRELTPLLFEEVRATFTELGAQLRPALEQISHGISEWVAQYGPAFSQMMHAQMVAAGLLEPPPGLPAR